MVVPPSAGNWWQGWGLGGSRIIVWTQIACDLDFHVVGASFYFPWSRSSQLCLFIGSNGEVLFLKDWFLGLMARDSDIIDQGCSLNIRMLGTFQVTVHPGSYLCFILVAVHPGSFRCFLHPEANLSVPSVEHSAWVKGQRWPFSGLLLLFIILSLRIGKNNLEERLGCNLAAGPEVTPSQWF